MCGPVLITAVVLALGTTRWLLLALSFVIGSLVTPAAARRARARPIVTRTPPAGPPTLAPIAAPAV
jgi:hypothetical protein